MKEAQATAKKELEKLRNAESNARNQREVAMESMEEQVRSAQKQVSVVKAECSVIKAKLDTISAELNALHQELQALNEQVTISQKGTIRLSNEIDRLSSDVANCKAHYDEAKLALANKQNELNHMNKEVKALEATRDKSTKTAQAASLEARKIAHKLKQWETESKSIVKKVAVMLRQHPWIEREKVFFGVPESDFDFKVQDPAQSQVRLNKLKSDQVCASL